MNHDQDCPCATDSVPHGAGCADCSCVKNICPTCEGDVKGELVDGKCRACQLGVIPDWMKPKGTEKRLEPSAPVKWSQTWEHRETCKGYYAPPLNGMVNCSCGASFPDEL